MDGRLGCPSNLEFLVDLTTESLTAFALRLPAPDRARLAEALLSSLEGAESDLDADWLAEAERRDRALEAEPDAGRRATEVFAAARARLASDATGG